MNAFLLMKVAWFLEGKWTAVIDLLFGNAEADVHVNCFAC